MELVLFYLVIFWFSLAMYLLERVKNMWKEYIIGVFDMANSDFPDTFSTKVFEEKIEEIRRNFRDMVTIPRALQ